MWKRENEPAGKPQTSASPAPPTAASRVDPELPASAPVPAPRPAPALRAIIGASIELTGELTGAEDLVVEGQVKGKIRLPQNVVTVGTHGRVSADVQARVVEIEGEVDGQISADELVTLRKSAKVRGDLLAPRVVIEDGAKFKGTIDMEPKRAASGSAAAAGPRPVPADEAARAAAGGASGPNRAS